METRRKAKCPVEICSFRSLSSKLVDAARYLEIRGNHPFGSVRSPEDETNIQVPPDEFIPIDLLNPNNNSMLPANSIASVVFSKPQIMLILGDFGAGKSMTLRNTYYELARNYHIGSSIRFPVYLNLRDHFGQRSPAEALMRHGEEIGFSSPHQLVAAWKAGHCHVLLDGFDELSSTRLVRGVRSLRQARREAMRLVHGFISLHPKDTSLLISGREHYFDSIDELFDAFGLDNNYSYYTLNEFTEDQIDRYLRKKRIQFIYTRLASNSSFAAWISRRERSVIR